MYGKEQKRAHQAVATLGDAARPIYLARLVAPRRQPQIGADAAPFAEPAGIIDRRHIGQGGDRPDAGNRHQAPAWSHCLGKRLDPQIEPGNLLAQHTPRQEKRVDDLSIGRLLALLRALLD